MVKGYTTLNEFRFYSNEICRSRMARARRVAGTECVIGFKGKMQFLRGQ